MKEVSCRVLDIFFRDLKRRRLSPQLLAIGSGYSVDHLRNKNERIEWASFVRIMTNASQIWSKEDCIRLGGAFFQNPLMRPFSLIARILFTPKAFYFWVTKKREGMGPQ